MDFRTDENLCNKLLEAAKKIDITAYTRPWNGNMKKQRLVAKLYFGKGQDPGLGIRSEITVAKEKIYWWIGLKSPVYLKYGEQIDEIKDPDWESNKPETRIIFLEPDEYFRVIDEMAGDVDDINVPKLPKEIVQGEDGTTFYVCGRCGESFKKAPRCPECGQLVKE